MNECTIMLEPWKMIYLPPPPVQTTKLKNKIDVKELEHACNNIIRVLSKQSPLHKESALLSRFLYKYDKKFRNDIGYRYIRKVNSTLKKYLQLNLYKDIENFLRALPQGDEDYFPTRQMLEYVLVRVIAFSKIMLRISMCSKQAAIFYLDRVKRGESHWMSLMPYALLSRVCSLCTVLLHHSTSWYACLYRYLKQLQPNGLKFLPMECDLPDDLENWLDLKNIDKFGKFNWSRKKNINVDLSMLDEEGSTFGEILGYINKINSENDDAIEENETLVLSTVPNIERGEALSRDVLRLPTETKIDLGEAVSRDSLLVQTAVTKASGAAAQESLNILHKFQKKIKSDDKVSHYFGKVTNLKSLTDFLDMEEIYRNDEDRRSLTSHLSFMQWQALKSSLLKVCDALSKSRKVEKKLLKVWKEKCIDCL